MTTISYIDLGLDFIRREECDLGYMSVYDLAKVGFMVNHEPVDVRTAPKIVNKMSKEDNALIEELFEYKTFQTHKRAADKLARYAKKTKSTTVVCIGSSPDKWTFLTDFCNDTISTVYIPWSRTMWMNYHPDEVLESKVMKKKLLRYVRNVVKTSGLLQRLKSGESVVLVDFIFTAWSLIIFATLFEEAYPEFVPKTSIFAVYDMKAFNPAIKLMDNFHSVEAVKFPLAAINTGDRCTPEGKLSLKSKNPTHVQKLCDFYRLALVYYAMKTSHSSMKS